MPWKTTEHLESSEKEMNKSRNQNNHTLGVQPSIFAVMSLEFTGKTKGGQKSCKDNLQNHIRANNCKSTRRHKIQKCNLQSTLRI